MSFWEWLTFAGTLASILGLFGFWSDRRTTKLITSIHTATQSTLGDMNKGFRESQDQMAKILERMDQRQDGMAQILERMDQRADERHRDTISAIEALRRA
jgi:uncharacterized membrane protein YccC